MSQWEMMLLNFNPKKIPRLSAYSCLYCGGPCSRNQKYCCADHKSRYNTIQRRSRNART